MSRATSATTGRRYGLKRVCGTWERSRSALYARRACLRRPERGDGPGHRGPTPALSDAQLLAAIRSDLARSPFQGEGHRKVHARLRILDRIRVSRTRVLRVMRTQGLLSPHRGRQGVMQAHEGTIVTSAPDVMWGTDGVRVFTAEDGWVWTFAAVDHWNAECVGWHVCKVFVTRGARTKPAVIAVAPAQLQAQRWASSLCAIDYSPRKTRCHFPSLSLNAWPTRSASARMPARSLVLRSLSRFPDDHAERLRRKRLASLTSSNARANAGGGGGSFPLMSPLAVTVTPISGWCSSRRRGSSRGLRGGRGGVREGLAQSRHCRTRTVGGYGTRPFNSSSHSLSDAHLRL